MRDPIRDLENLGTGDLPGVPPLPAPEVRRLGDRMRRRRQAGVALAAAAAVAAVATTGAAVGGVLDRADGPSPARTPSATATASPTPTPAPTPAPLTEIPADFPIAANLGEPVDVTDTALLAERLTYCGERPLAPVTPVDSLSAEHSGGETSELRTVLLFPDERGAATAEQDLLDAAAACPSDRSVDLVREVLPRSPDWAGSTVLATFPNESGGTAADIQHVMRSGPALLLSTSYRAPEDVERTRDDLAPLVSALVELTGEDVAGPDGDPTPRDEDPSALAPTGPQEIPDEFPLAAGWPERTEPGADHGLTGPDRSLRPIEIRFCGDERSVVGQQDRLRADWRDVEDLRERELATFPDAGAAVAQVAGIRAVVDACPSEGIGDGYTRNLELRRTALGGESWAIVVTYEFDGAPAMGLDVIHVIRLGRSVLIDTTNAHGGVGPDPQREVADRIESMSQASAEPLAAMCRFTEAGC